MCLRGDHRLETNVRFDDTLYHKLWVWSGPIRTGPFFGFVAVVAIATVITIVDIRLTPDLHYCDD